jgi:hypothetical protein
MNNPKFLSLSPGILQCEVCGKPVNYLQALQQQGSDNPVCNSFDCNRIINQRGYMSDAMFRSRVDFQRKLLEQHRSRQEEMRLRVEQIIAHQKLQEKEILSRVLAVDAQLDSQLQSVVIHKGLSSETRLSETRILDYLNHLNTIIEEAASYQSIDDCVQDEHFDAQRKLENVDSIFTENPDLRRISDQLCSICKGGCCVSGREHAYLSVFTMRQQLDRNPAWTQQDLFQQYVKRISAYSIDGSCINHTTRGCALPRDLRSNICNAFYCDDLKRYQQVNQNSEPEKILVIQREASYSPRVDPEVKNNVVNVALVDSDSVREMKYINSEIELISE